ncbi:MAG: hypothetical protein KDC44_17855, partial [Phaeodactylibacter sp.]|nr:hypothetical protein [Phaeodactylibacter sp.]
MNALIRMVVPLTGIALVSFCLLFSSCTSSGSKGGPTHTISLFEHLVQQDIQTVELEMDFRYLKETEADDYQPASLRWQDGDGTVDIPLLTKPRGKTRREMCEFPPIKLKLDTTLVIQGQLIEPGKYKLVTHCSQDAGGEELLLREQVAYNIFDALTEKGFRTKLLRVTYKDLQGQELPGTHWAILLENTNDLERRLKVQELADEAPLKQVSADDYNLFVLYQFMIGNTDWNLNNRHNVKLFLGQNGLPYPVPYDFDYSGLVNASYAKPYPTMPIESVRDRFLQWRGKNRELLEPSIELLKSKREAVLASCDLMKKSYPGAWQDMV